MRARLGAVVIASAEACAAANAHAPVHEHEHEHDHADAHAHADAGADAGADAVAVAPAVADAASDAAVWIRFGHPLPDSWLRCASDDDCAVASGLYCWPMAVNVEHAPEVNRQLGERLQRGETCAKPGCGAEFHASRCRAQHCKLIDGCQGGSR